MLRFVRSWAEVRDLSQVYLVSLWRRGRHVLLFCPEHTNPYVLLLREPKKPFCAYEHEAGLALKPRMLALFRAQVRAHQLQVQGGTAALTPILCNVPTH